MRFVHAALFLAVSASPALAQRQPVIVIPGRPDVPIMMNGVDVSYAVIEGEFGLDRPIMVNPTVIYRPFAIAPAYGPEVYPGGYVQERGYFPSTGQRPGYGRLEILPPRDRPLPPPAPTFYRSWSSQSDPGPVTDYAPSPPLPVVVEPQFGRRNLHGHNHAPKSSELGQTGPGPTERHRNEKSP